MGIRHLEEFLEKEQLMKHGSLNLLRNSTIGIDATHFAKQYLAEHLLTALGGSPIALEGIINALRNLKEAGISMHFVFDGLKSNITDDQFMHSGFISSQNDAAFAQYDNQQPELARKAFQSLAPLSIQENLGPLKLALHELSVPYTVAPYSALAQLAYYERHPLQFVDAVYGPLELFYFGAEKVISDLTDFLPKDHPEKNEITDSMLSADKIQFSWIDKPSCLKSLGGVHPQIFQEALVIVGSDQYLSTFPPLLDNTIYNKSGTLRDAISLLLPVQGDVSNLCSQYPDAVSLRDSWLPKYKQAMAVFKHHVIISSEGEVESLSKDGVPVDLHECIGLRLPEELYMYLYRGLINSRVLNYLVRSEVSVLTPLAGGNTKACQDFDSVELSPLKKQAICILTEGLARYFRQADFKFVYWFDRQLLDKFRPADQNPPLKNLVEGWNVKKDLIAQAQHQFSRYHCLSSAIINLNDIEFAQRTQSPSAKRVSQLTESDELVANTVWRFLQLRDFTDSNHRLTQWGAILQAALQANGQARALEEPIYLGIELLRLGYLNANTMFTGYKGSPTHGTMADRGFCMLISRVSSLARLRHKSKGYSGPLSRSLLAYHSLISSLHTSLRDLLEMILVSMFLNGNGKRERSDWADLAESLPFYNLPSCSLGIAVLTYLDHLEIHGDPTVKETQNQTRDEAQGWIQHSEFDQSLQDAFAVWDAVYAGVQEAGDLVKDRGFWDDANKWLALRR